MATPYLFYDELLADSVKGGYTERPKIKQLSSVFLLSLCVVAKMRWLWQNPIAPIDDIEWQSIQDMIMQAESDLMKSFGIGSIIPSIANLDSESSLLRLNGQTVAQVDYLELSDVVPVSWLVGLNIVLPDMNDLSIHGDYSNVGSVIGSNTHTLTIDQIPSHTHTQLPHSHTEVIPSITPTGAGPIVAGASIVLPIPSVTGLATATNNSTGGGNSHNNIPESMTVIYYLVAR